MKHLDLDESLILSYITGELTELEEKEFEKRLESDEILKAQVEELSAVQGQLSTWKDEEIDVPTIGELVPANNRRRFISTPISGWVKVAAAVGLLIMLGWLTDLQINQTGQSIVLSFGPQQSLEQDLSTGFEERMQSMLDDQKIELDHKFEAILSAQEGLSRQLESADQTELFVQYKEGLDGLKTSFASFESRQLGQLNDVLASLDQEQEARILDVLLTSHQFLAEQRQQDLARIEDAFRQLNESINIQWIENDKLLNNLLTSNNY